MKTFINEKTRFEVGSLEKLFPEREVPQKDLYLVEKIKGIQVLMIEVIVFFSKLINIDDCKVTKRSRR